MGHVVTKYFTESNHSIALVILVNNNNTLVEDQILIMSSSNCVSMFISNLNISNF